MCDSFSRLQEQQLAEQAFKEYFEAKRKDPKDAKHSKELLSLERKALASMDYLVDMVTAKYKRYNNYQDQRQSVYLAIVYAMQTYDPQKSNSFTYWVSLYLIKVRREAEKERNWKLYRKPVENFEMWSECHTNDANGIDGETQLQITRALNKLSEEEYQQILNCQPSKIKNQEREIINKLKESLWA